MLQVRGDSGESASLLIGDAGRGRALGSREVKPISRMARHKEPRAAGESNAGRIRSHLKPLSNERDPA